MTRNHQPVLWNTWQEAVSHQSCWICEHQDALLVFLQAKHWPQSSAPSREYEGLDMGYRQGLVEAWFRQYELGPCIINELLTKQLNSCQLGSSLLQPRHSEGSSVTTIPTSIQNHISLRTILHQPCSPSAKIQLPRGFPGPLTAEWGVPLKVPLPISLLLPRASSELVFLTSATEKRLQFPSFAVAAKPKTAQREGAGSCSLLHIINAVI